MFNNPELERMLKEPYLDSTKLMALIRRYRCAKDPEKKYQLREEIFNNNVRFIRKLVMRKVKAPDIVEDVFNSAVISFFEGLDKFKPKKGFKFQTYIAYWIEKAVYEEYVGNNIVTMSKGDFFKRDVPATFLAKNFSLTYLDRPIETEDGGSISQCDLIDKHLMSKVHDKENDYVKDKMMKINRAAKVVLLPYEYDILYWHYVCDPPLTLLEIATITKLSKERIRQIGFRATYKIRKYVNTDGRYIDNYDYRSASIPNYTAEERSRLYELALSKRVPKKTPEKEEKIKPNKM